MRIANLGTPSGDHRRPRRPRRAADHHGARRLEGRGAEWLDRALSLDLRRADQAEGHLQDRAAAMKACSPATRRAARSSAGAAAPENFAKEVPQNAEDLQASFLQSRIETFVTSGKPTTETLKITGSGLELAPVTHPNDLIAGSAATFQLMLDGKPAAEREDVGRARRQPLSRQARRDESDHGCRRQVHASNGRSPACTGWRRWCATKCRR